MKLEFEFSTKFKKKLYRSVIFKKDDNRIIDILKTSFKWCISRRHRYYMKMSSWLRSNYNEFVFSDVANELDELYNEIVSRKNWSQDTIMLEAIKFVNNKNIQYEDDFKQHRSIDEWTTTSKLFLTKKGDCEDINAAIFCVAKYLGIPEIKLMNILGYALNGQYHYGLLYLSTLFNKVVSIDGTYKNNLLPISQRKPFHGEVFKSMNYIFNSEDQFIILVATKK